jgi:hypothetical protein
MAGMVGPWGLACPEFSKETPDLYRVKNEVKKLNPFACLAFPVLTSPKKAPKYSSFGDELVTTFSHTQPHPRRGSLCDSAEIDTQANSPCEEQTNQSKIPGRRSH